MIELNDDQVVARMAKKIEQLEHLVGEYDKAMQDIHCALFCVGAPLNDNNLNFNSEQMKYLQKRIARNVILKDHYSKGLL